MRCRHDRSWLCFCSCAACVPHDAIVLHLSLACHMCCTLCAHPSVTIVCIRHLERSHTGGGSNAGAIAGGIIGAILAIIAIAVAVAVFCYCKKKERAKKAMLDDPGVVKAPPPAPLAHQAPQPGFHSHGSLNYGQGATPGSQGGGFAVATNPAMSTGEYVGV